jgi:nicotinamidase-related amidase
MINDLEVRMLSLQMRRRHVLRSDAQPEEVIVPQVIAGNEVALLLCDMWDKHWCASATARCEVLAHTMNPVLDGARRQGVRIIHAPSDCMEFYARTPQRARMRSIAPLLPPPPPRAPSWPPLPIDDSDGGCDDQNPGVERIVWTRQHPAIIIADEDVISDDGTEIRSLLQQEGRTLLLLMGVHTNMCILNRSFGIRQMLDWGMECALVRDMTDAMYNPARSPYVSHADGTRLVIEYIEHYYCPTLASADLVGD